MSQGGIEQYYPAADRTVLTRSEATPEGYLDLRSAPISIHSSGRACHRQPDSAARFRRGAGEGTGRVQAVCKGGPESPSFGGTGHDLGLPQRGARAYAGEGLVGFTWAFLSAGAHNVIAGLWNVDDRLLRS